MSWIRIFFTPLFLQALAIALGMLLGLMLYAFGMSKYFYRMVHIKWLYLQVKSVDKNDY